MTVMKVAVNIGSWASGAERDWPEVVRLAVQCERLGVDFCWSAEAWGQDCIAPLAYLAARTERMRLGTGIMQISARVPSMAAMTAMTMAAISGDRFVLGLGVSGPQVVEGLHGVAFGQPVGRLTEYLDILDLAFAGEPLAYSGSHYVLPGRTGRARYSGWPSAPSGRSPSTWPRWRRAAWSWSAPGPTGGSRAPSSPRPRRPSPSRSGAARSRPAAT
jgi:alkanesulfonate monooxygenase SsuD/methylene tetrahydromethanopterin reductase-like flavin-dependent oxidoreductase (luciferase family)